MNRHLSDGSLLSLAQGGGASAECAHAAACGRCAERVEDIDVGENGTDRLLCIHVVVTP